ncbi:uncharacterized protein LOC118199974 [Stegodyphus dumicola]|uniref:uncharacterized protein LOC118199974 n=1 Tax=Stegodyphus dumicola TaxID=202533 RepID=UPI0015B16A24|nr:uncharacterized protein LOC118199974 [Stegodyphus dumicola]
MKVLLFSGLFLLASCAASKNSFSRGIGNGGRGNLGGFGRFRGPPPPMFPKCKEFEQAVNEKMEEKRMSGEIGPSNCRSGNMEECRFNDLLKARQEVTVEPTEECLDQVNQYMKGTLMTTESTSSNDYGDSDATLL